MNVLDHLLVVILSRLESSWHTEQGLETTQKICRFFYLTFLFVFWLI